MTWSCPSCGTMNTANAAACPVCGQGRPILDAPAAAPASLPAVPVVRIERTSQPTATGTTSSPSGRSVSAAPADAASTTGAAAGEPIPSPARRTSLTPLVVGLVALGLLAGAVGYAVAASAGQRSPEASQDSQGEEAAAERGDPTATPPDSAEPATATTRAVVTTPRPTTTDPAPTTAPPPVLPRAGTLYAGIAKLRSTPGGPDVVREFSGVEGTALTVLEPADDHGWYRVSIGGSEGYLYGAFVRPPDPGLCIGVGVGGDLRFYRPDGSLYVPEGGTNPSGTKVVVVSEVPEDGRYPVVVADGFQGYVLASDLKSLECR